ncbi:MAG: ATP-binding protein [Nitrospirota bacterium]|nr:ATP-binding protein [Nitrospirota bacterium]
MPEHQMKNNGIRDFLTTNFPRLSKKRDCEDNPSQADKRGDDLLRFIHETSHAIVSVLDGPLLNDRIVETFMDAFELEGATLFLPDLLDSGPYVAKAQVGTSGPDLMGLRIQREDFLVACLRRGQCMLASDSGGVAQEDLTQIYAFSQLAELGGEVCLPFADKGRLAGFCVLGGKKNGAAFTDAELTLLSILAGYSAIAIENARLFESTKKMKISLRRSDRLASLGTLTAGLAHEIRNPLVSVHTFLQLLPERYDDEEFRTQFHALACDEIERLNMLMEELLAFAKPSEPNLRPTSLNDTVDKMLILVGSECKKKGIEIIRDFSDNMPEIVMDKEQLKQVLMNLFLNAVQAMPAGGTLEVRTVSLATGGRTDFVQIEVKDTGVGIPESAVDNLFNPFFTTKEQGTGLGLAIAYQIIREHRGFIDVESKEGCGAAFFITLPVDPRDHERRHGDRTNSERYKP